ncbi:hypothetical protein E2C01_049935 [Portunus trituberculatus]|uniref:Uncharacterized protein n=1 Tax=Portunus trituberculatus TaxID=210409 RepID=A0A5B7GEK2_PORTR|nr:hypothetical protein [Portunus trituberculatus]
MMKGKTAQVDELSFRMQVISVFAARFSLVLRTTLRFLASCCAILRVPSSLSEILSSFPHLMSFPGFRRNPERPAFHSSSSWVNLATGMSVLVRRGRRGAGLTRAAGVIPSLVTSPGPPSPAAPRIKKSLHTLVALEFLSSVPCTSVLGPLLSFTPSLRLFPPHPHAHPSPRPTINHAASLSRH